MAPDLQVSLSGQSCGSRLTGERKVASRQTVGSIDMSSTAAASYERPGPIGRGSECACAAGHLKYRRGIPSRHTTLCKLAVVVVGHEALGLGIEPDLGSLSLYLSHR